MFIEVHLVYNVSCHYIPLGYTTPPLVLVDGGVSSRTEFCVGENVTFICFLLNNAHQWNVPGYIDGDNGTVHRTSEPIEFGPFITLRTFTDPNDDQFSSSLSVIIFPDFQGANITCSNFTILSTLTFTGVQVLGEAK